MAEEMKHRWTLEYALCGVNPEAYRTRPLFRFLPHEKTGFERSKQRHVTYLASISYEKKTSNLGE